MSFITESEIMGGVFGDYYTPIQNEPMGRDYAKSNVSATNPGREFYDYYPLSTYFSDTAGEYSNHITNRQGEPGSWSVEDERIEEYSHIPGFRDDDIDKYRRDGSFENFQSFSNCQNCGNCQNCQNYGNCQNCGNCRNSEKHNLSVMMMFIFIIVLVVIIAIANTVNTKKLVKLAKFYKKNSQV